MLKNRNNKKTFEDISQKKVNKTNYEYIIRLANNYLGLIDRMNAS